VRVCECVYVYMYVCTCVYEEYQTKERKYSNSVWRRQPHASLAGGTDGVSPD
jgi:hypothetical protein